MLGTPECRDSECPGKEGAVGTTLTLPPPTRRLPRPQKTSVPTGEP